MVKLKEVSIGKEIKIGLPNFSNCTVNCDLKFELGEGESPNWDEWWDIVNQQLSIQSDNIDQSWITNNEYKNFFKTTIKTKKVDKLFNGEKK